MSQQGHKGAVLKPHARSSRSYVDNIYAGVASLSSWAAHASGWSSAPHVDSSAKKIESDVVTTAAFFDIELIPQRPPVSCLLVGHPNGFEMWDASREELQQLLSVKGPHVRKFAILPAPREDDAFDEAEPEPASDREALLKRTIREACPLILYTSGEGKAMNQVQLYSIRQNKFLRPIEVHGTVHEVLANTKAVILLMTGSAVVLNAETMERVSVIPLYAGHPHLGPVAALHTRWFAFQCPVSMSAGDLQDRQMLLPSDYYDEMTERLRGDVVDGNVDDSGARGSRRMSSEKPNIAGLQPQRAPTEKVLWTVGRSLADLSASTVPTVTSMIQTAYHTATGVPIPANTPSTSSPSSLPRHPPGPSSLPEHSPGSKTFSTDQEAGLLLVLDLHNWPQRLASELSTMPLAQQQKAVYKTWERIPAVAHFRATTSAQSAVATISFDASGTLLAAAHERGDVVRIFRITPTRSVIRGEGILKAAECMYVLQRGVTSAFVQEIAFSPDQRLVAVVSAPKGTAHLFPISPYGGYVDAHSHLQPPTRINFQHTLQNHHKRVPITPSKIGMLKRASRAPAHVSHATPTPTISSSSSASDVPHPHIAPFGAVVKFEGRIGHEYSALVLDNSGTLTSYIIKLHESDVDVRALAGTTTARHEWNIVGTHDGNVPFDPTSIRPLIVPGQIANVELSMASQLKQQHTKWLANIETDQTIFAMEHSPYWVLSDAFQLEVWTDPLPDFDPNEMRDPVKQDAILASLPKQVVRLIPDRAHPSPRKDALRKDKEKERDREREREREKERAQRRKPEHADAPAPDKFRIVENLVEVHADYLGGEEGDARDAHPVANNDDDADDERRELDANRDEEDPIEDDAIRERHVDPDSEAENEDNRDADLEPPAPDDEEPYDYSVSQLIRDAKKE